ncbi:alpha/beta fold hydrolase [Actinoplanes sp. RD1]|uniref:alpha/beta fold hydrolase n=1 Tax=Actinoplanes sp. RD1 TaxID=3064538 RepID=UPI0027426D79|nr:alpha/beta hydrolase [Actinoplanes sp. RD1]
MRVVFVHGACVRDGRWWWHPAAEVLRERGIGSVAPALPSCGEGERAAGPDGPGLADDVAAVRAVLAGSDEPTVVVAHSYGGIVAAEAAARPQQAADPTDVAQQAADPVGGAQHAADPTGVAQHAAGPTGVAQQVAGSAGVAGLAAGSAGVAGQSARLGGVQHLVLVSSYLPEPGESLSAFGAQEPPAYLDFDPVGGTFGARPELFAETFAQDCPPELVRGGQARLARQTLTVTQEPVRAAAWRDVPTTYVVCTEDRGTPAEAQRRFARRADRVVELRAGHHPFLSQPRAVADIISGLPGFAG